jgi:hypothetical protein
MIEAVDDVCVERRFKRTSPAGRFLSEIGAAIGQTI